MLASLGHANKFTLRCNLNVLSAFPLDVDECLLGSHSCQQLCFNVPGSFRCGCRTGYLLEDDLSHCIGTYVCVNGVGITCMYV